jgi:site-specific DNA-methyltransferase (adenine-specific)
MGVRMSTSHRVIIADSRRMPELPDGSVHLIVTSPHWQLKDYGSGGQIGFHDSYEDYINNLDLVWSECARVLHPGCRLCINIGDQFARSVYYGRYKVIPIRTEITKFCEGAGLDFMGSVIWRKVTTCNTTGGATVMGSFPYPRNGILKIDYEFILIFKKPGEPPVVPPEAKSGAKLTTKEWNEYFSGHWTFPGQKQKGHLAMFPEELPRRLIRMFTFEGETVLDPFLGSGTTSLAALKLGRNSVGYEVNGDFVPLIRAKLGCPERRGQPTLEEVTGGSGASVVFERRTPGDFDLQAAIARLPYIFSDPHRMDKRQDPRKAGFGSRIDGPATEKRGLLSVKEIPSPEAVVLDDGRRLRLLGIKARPGLEDEAVAFLRARTRGQKVFVQDETALPDGTPAGYLYLKNRTLLNAHMLKRGLALADDSVPHRHAARFASYQKG